MVAPTLPAPITVILLFIVPDHFPSCAVPDGEHNVPPRAGSSELYENKGAKHSFPLSPLTGVHTQPNKFYHIDIFLSSIFAIFLYENIGIYGFFRK